MAEEMVMEMVMAMEMEMGMAMEMEMEMVKVTDKIIVQELIITNRINKDNKI